MEQRWTRKEEDGYVFKDFLGTGELVPYEDWRQSFEERAKDLAERIAIEDIAGLMLYSAHQLIPAKGPLAAAFGGTDPRHGAGSMAEYMGVTGEPISRQPQSRKMVGEKTVSIPW